MGHYDDIRDEREQREEELSLQKTGLSLSDWRILQFLQDKVDAYDDFMDIETKREALETLKRKGRALLHASELLKENNHAE